MTPDSADALSLAEFCVLGVVAEGRRHGFAVARLLAADGELGAVFTVARPAVYRAIERLAEVGLIRPLGVERGERGPRRTPLEATLAGRRHLDAWLATPVRHVRLLRTEFLVKMALIDRSERDALPLIEAQIGALTPVVEAMAASFDRADGPSRTTTLWRVRSAQSALRFLQELEGERAER